MKRLVIFITLFVGVWAMAQQRLCPTCNGNKGWACSSCYGYGVQWMPIQTPWGIQNQKVQCSKCGGYGRIACSTCNGYGVIYSTRSNPTFGGRKYDCERCLCTRYSPKSTFNSDCKNCQPSHPRSWHYSQK